MNSPTLRLMGFDYGTRRIGVAVGQTLTRTAMAVAVVPVRANEPDWSEIDKLVQEWRPGAFVVGMPYSMDGSENDMTARVVGFSRALSGRYDKPLHTVDERLSTRAAREISRGNAELIGRKYDDKTRVDALAAQLMLESWLGMNA